MKTELLILLLAMTFRTNSIAQNLDSIRTELEREYNSSLSLRQKVMPTIKKYGYKSKQMDSLNAVILKSDSIALGRVISIVDKYGWLGNSKIGDVANQTLYLTIQHADKNLRNKYFPLLEASAKNGESSLYDMATMKDRICVDKGQEQIYGTQKDMEGKYFPIADLKGLNKRRKQVGLKKLKISNEDIKNVNN